MMMPIWSPKFKNNLVDEGVSTILAQHLEKDFVGAQPSPTTVNDTIIHTRDIMCGTFADASWISSPMGELLHKQSKFP